MQVRVFIGTAGSWHKEAEGESEVKKLRLQNQLHSERSFLGIKEGMLDAGQRS